MNMQLQVTEEHGEILSLLDRLADISCVRVWSHFEHAYLLNMQRKETSPEEETGDFNFLVAGNFLAGRACYTTEAISCLLWHGFADAAYESWRTMYNLEVNMATLTGDPDPEKAAERYLSSTLQDYYDHESKLARAGFTDPAESEEMKPLMDRLKEEYPGISGRDGWILRKADRDPAKRARSAGTEFEYRWDYDLASKLAHGEAISMLLRPGAYFPHGGQGELPPVRPSPVGIEQVTILTARALCSIVGEFVHGTLEPELPEEKDWRQDSDLALRRPLLVDPGRRTWRRPETDLIEYLCSRHPACL